MQHLASPLAGTWFIKEGSKLQRLTEGHDDDGQDAANK
jgi:hypothetical protein